MLFVLISAYLYLVPSYKYEAYRAIDNYIKEQNISKSVTVEKMALEKNWKYGWYSCTVHFSDDPDVDYTYIYSRSYDAGQTGVHLETFGIYDENKKPKHSYLPDDSQDIDYLR
ncbi:DUF3139 domain-containing protein [Brochothrix thermosphacta]|uniref:DUF3139 domain-containing protein n=2 Tax=Brochothrix thermosphacta TaxID=2756 RepID=UPI0039AF9F01